MVKFLNKYCNEYNSFGYSLLFSIILILVFVTIGSVFLQKSEILFGSFFILGIFCYHIPCNIQHFFSDKKFCNMCHEWYFGKFIKTKIKVREYGHCFYVLTGKGYYEYKEERKICKNCYNKKYNHVK